MEKKKSMEQKIDFIIRSYSKGKKLGCIAHLGAGVGEEISGYLDCSPKKIVLVEANPPVADRLRDEYQSDNILVQNIAVAACAETAKPFYITRPKALSGMLVPHEIHNIFPNLQVKQTLKLDTTSLSSWIESFYSFPDDYNVLVVQLNGGEKSLFENVETNLLQFFSLIIVDEDGRDLFANPDVGNKLSTTMERCGFILVEDRDTTLFHRTVYQKNVNAILHAKEVAELTQARDAQAKLAAERQGDIVALQQDLDAKSIKVAELTQARDVQAKLAMERQDKIVHLQQQLKDSSHEKDAIIAEKENKIDCLETELNETHHRQKLLDEEMLKAEAQIDLIKDLLLREEGI